MVQVAAAGEGCSVTGVEVDGDGARAHAGSGATGHGRARKKARGPPGGMRRLLPFLATTEAGYKGGAQQGRQRRGNMQLPDQISKHLRGGMQIFMKALPRRHLSCMPAYMALHALLA